MFSSSSKEITNRITDYLEKEGELFTFRLYRDSCYMTDNSLFVKDLRIINRPLDRMLLIDDCTYSFGFQLDSGIPIVPFTGSKDDSELIILSQYIDYVFSQKDPRQANREYFKFYMYGECSNTDDVFHRIFHKK